MLYQPPETLDEQVEHCMKLMDVDKDGVISYMDYKLSLSRNPMLLEMINPFSIHSILEDATSGNPTRVSRVSLECSKACSHHTVSSHQPRHRGSLIEEGDWATMMASKKTHVDPVTGNGGGVHAMKQSVSAKRIRPGKKRQANIFLEQNRWRSKQTSCWVPFCMQDVELVPFVDFAGAGLSRVLSKMFMIMLLLRTIWPPWKITYPRPLNIASVHYTSNEYHDELLKTEYRTSSSTKETKTKKVVVVCNHNSSPLATPRLSRRRNPTLHCPARNLWRSVVVRIRFPGSSNQLHINWSTRLSPARVS